MGDEGESKKMPSLARQRTTNDAGKWQLANAKDYLGKYVTPAMP